MKPKPFSALKNLTVPVVAMVFLFFLRPSQALAAGDGGDW
jgi:hypothetical protein